MRWKKDMTLCFPNLKILDKSSKWSPIRKQTLASAAEPSLWSNYDCAVDCISRFYACIPFLYDFSTFHNIFATCLESLSLQYF